MSGSHEDERFLTEERELSRPNSRGVDHSESEAVERVDPSLLLQKANLGKWRKPIQPPASRPQQKFACRYKVDGCNWSFVTPAKRDRHEKTHKNVGLFQCQLCDTLVKHEYNMYEHWRTTCRELFQYYNYENKSLSIPQLKRRVIVRMKKLEIFDESANTGGMLFIPSAQTMEDISEQ